MLDFLFVLPGASGRPIGGYKVVYEYANHLSESGYKVGILYITHMRGLVSKTIFKSFYRHVLHSLKGAYRPKWFNLKKDVRVFQLLYNRPKLFPPSKVCIATAWETALPVRESLSFSNAKGLYLIQGFETWSATVDQLYTSYTCGLDNIAVSKWLQQLVESAGATCVRIPNGLNFNDFYVDNCIKERNPYNLMTLYHIMPAKGFEEVLAAVEVVRAKYPQIKLSAFGAYPIRHDVPEWVSYRQTPSIKELRSMYNSAALFMSGSHNEGWGLSACEAMQCGCALVATDIPGHREFAEHDKNSLLSPVGDAQAMATNLLRMIEDQELRVHLANAASMDVRKFSWDHTIELFLKKLDPKYD